MTQAEYDEVSDKALRLFEFGQVSRLLLRLFLPFLGAVLKFDFMSETAVFGYETWTNTGGH